LTPEGWFDPKPSADAGAFHAGEILYVFDNLHAFPWLIDQHDRAIAALTSNYWVNFIKTGDPNGAGLPHWPCYRDAEAPLMAIDAPAKVQTDTDHARHEFLTQTSKAR
jgi:para-nitrobenzyl esterase